MTRIQYIIATLDRAGAEGQLTALLTRLDRSRFEPHLICLTRGGHHEAALKDAGVPYEILGKSGKADPFAVLRLRKLMKKFKPEILHTWMFTSNAYGRVAGILAGVPIRIAAERAVDSWKTWPYKVTDRLLAPWTHRIVGNCEAIREFVASETRADRKKLAVIPNGVDVSLFEPKQHTAKEEVCFCTIGRLASQKRMDLFIKALSILSKRKQRVRGVIAGDGPLRDDLQKLATEEGIADRVDFIGATEDVPGLLARSDTFILASDWEGMPNVVLEAMASGLPVVGTAIDGTKEIVEEGGTGFLVPSDDAEALATAMNELTASVELRSRMGQAGRHRAESEYSMERMVERYESLYTELVSG
ncbi:MAG: glycosyltransferase [Planctomycetota bacterium]|nr:glycosyltransferase [Planctomycetota bacterium]MDP7134941.1 glycosyltransferase [Planctomycetota bacterium]MDP7252758.1 glycosyltransferase [Planctomycetota bacterium]